MFFTFFNYNFLNHNNSYSEFINLVASDKLVLTIDSITEQSH